MRKHQTMRKRDCHQARKDFNKKKEMKRIECKNFHQDERKMIYQKTQEKWDSKKDHSSWEGCAKNEDSSKVEIFCEWRLLGHIWNLLEHMSCRIG